MSERTVYLAGPMTGLNLEGANFWRRRAADLLCLGGIKAISPTRNKEFLRNQQEIVSAPYAHTLATDLGIVTRDRNDVRRADAILMNLVGSKRISIGTMVEIGWADAFRKPVVVIMELSGNVHDHPFVRQLTQYQVATVEDGVEVIESLLL